MRSMRREQVARGLKQMIRIADRGKGREGKRKRDGRTSQPGLWR